MGPWVNAGHQGGRAGGGEIAAGVVGMVDRGALGETGQVRGGGAGIAVNRHVPGGKGVKNEYEDILPARGGGAGSCVRHTFRQQGQEGQEGGRLEEIAPGDAGAHRLNIPQDDHNQAQHVKGHIDVRQD